MALIKMARKRKPLEEQPEVYIYDGSDTETKKFERIPTKEAKDNFTSS